MGVRLLTKANLFSNTYNILIRITNRQKLNMYWF